MTDDTELALHDAAHLEWARRMARAGWGRVHPNPMVGCVLVNQGKMVGQGYHEEFGGPHAEIVALERARTQAQGATAYVSLEPCNHFGKTAPCAEALIRAGVRRVVFGASDPGAESGGGAATLREAGIEVVGPVWSDQTAWSENAAFFHEAAHEAPFVALKLAMSLDGKVAGVPGRRTRITGLEADREVHRLRSGFDAILVGSGTAAADDPRLTVRLVPEGRRAPQRIVVAGAAELAADAALFTDAERIPLRVFCRRDASEAAISELENRGAHVHPVAEASDGLDLGEVLSKAHELGLSSILCEGGPRLAASLLRAGLVNRLYLFVAPVTLGEDGLAAFGSRAEALDWEAFVPAEPPQAFGRDTLVVLDRAVH